jgi:hypothetical protein
VKIIAIDASRRAGMVSRSVETAAVAAERAGAMVDRVRLKDIDIRPCTGCLMCQADGTCKMQDDLPELAERIADADGVIFGVPAYFHRPDETTRALLDRLSHYFADDLQLHLPGLGRRHVRPTLLARAAKRAVIITACKAPEPLATFFGYTTGPVRELRKALSSGGIRTIGSLAVTDTWRHPAGDEWGRDRAASLGRVLAGKI